MNNTTLYVCLLILINANLFAQHSNSTSHESAILYCSDVTTSNLLQINLNTKSKNILSKTNSNKLHSIALDKSSNLLFFCDYANPSNISVINTKTLITTRIPVNPRYCRDLVYNTKTKLLYFNNKDKICSYSVEMKSDTILYKTENPIETLVLDTLKNNLYFSTSHRKPGSCKENRYYNILKLDLNNTDKVELLVDNLSGWIQQLVLENSSNTLYWTDVLSNCIYNLELNQVNATPKQVIKNIETPIGLALDRNFMYLSDRTTNKVYKHLITNFDTKSEVVEITNPGKLTFGSTNTYN